jgi:hypothetical protein
MVGNEEESAPQPDSKDERPNADNERSEAGEANDSETTGYAAAAGGAEESDTLTPQIEATLLRIREALEQKDFETIALLIGLNSIFINGHPEPTAAIVSNVTAMAANLCDFEGVLLRVNRNQIDENQGRFSLRFRIMWSSCDDWEEFDLYLDAHAGYERKGNEWELQYLSLSQAAAPQQTPPQAAAPSTTVASPAAAPAAAAQAMAALPETSHAAAEETVRHSIPPRPKAAKLPKTLRRGREKRPLALPAERHSSAPAAPPKPAEKPLTDDYFTAAAAQYFAQLGPEKPAEAKPVVLGSSIGGKHHLLYVPIVMHEDLIKKIVGGE